MCTLLDSHPDILCHHELFNPEGIHIAWSLRGSGFSLGDLPARQADPLGLLERAWQQHLDFRAVGFKLNIHGPPEVQAAVLEDPAVLKIVLERRSRIRSFLSEQIAERTGVWESYPDSRRQEESTAAVHVDAADLLGHAERNRRYYAGLRQRLVEIGQVCHELVFEELADPETQCSLLRFLGVDDSVALTGNTRRMNPQSLDALIANLSQLRDELVGTPLAGELATAHSPDKRGNT